MSSSHQGSFGRAGAWHGRVWHSPHYSHLSLLRARFLAATGNELVKCHNHLRVAQDTKHSHLTSKPGRVQHVFILIGFTNQDQALHLPVICTCGMVIKPTGVIQFVKVNSINWFSCVSYIEHAKRGLSCQE